MPNCWTSFKKRMVTWWQAVFRKKKPKTEEVPDQPTHSLVEESPLVSDSGQEIQSNININEVPMKAESDEEPPNNLQNHVFDNLIQDNNVQPIMHSPEKPEPSLFSAATLIITRQPEIKILYMRDPDWCHSDVVNSPAEVTIEVATKNLAKVTGLKTKQFIVYSNISKDVCCCDKSTSVKVTYWLAETHPTAFVMPSHKWYTLEEALEVSKDCVDLCHLIKDFVSRAEDIVPPWKKEKATSTLKVNETLSGGKQLETRISPIARPISANKLGQSGSSPVHVLMVAQAIPEVVSGTQISKEARYISEYPNGWIALGVIFGVYLLMVVAGLAYFYKTQV